MIAISNPASLLKAAGDIGYVWNVTTDAMVLSGALSPFSGELKEHAVITGADFIARVHASDRPLFHAAMQASPATTPIIDREYRLQLAGGDFAWVHERGSVQRSPDGTVREIDAVLRIITARKTLEADLVARTHTDSLTGLPNRLHLLELFEAQLRDATPHDQHLGYGVIAIDNMRYVNEAIGPAAADAVILGVLKRVRGVLAPLQAEPLTLGRVGGDQFGFILPHCTSAKLTHAATALQQAFRDEAVESPLCPIQVSVSIGGVIAPLAARTAWEAMIRAEQALRDAQAQSRNGFLEYTASPARTAAHRRSVELGKQVLHALKHDGMRLAFQPVIDAKSQKIVSFEALVRMVDAEGHYVPNAFFIPVVESLGLIQALDTKVLALAIAALEADPALHLAVNVSGITASHQEWPAIFCRQVEHKPELARRITVEITETAAILDIATTKAFIDIVHQLGGKVALDDFGSGFTAIQYLRSLAIDILKIDRKLILNLLEDPDQQVITHTLIALAKGLHIKTVAEGVETAEVADWLVAAGIDHLQGYYYGKPEIDSTIRICERYNTKGLK